ncbi:MAG TPA: GDSL-type esterase/lipase family protein [Polyangiaceae bacterium]|nr:GDSL-type esterase/lipase family protein [Polyangiaceae bacterium]
MMRNHITKSSAARRPTSRGARGMAGAAIVLAVVGLACGDASEATPVASPPAFEAGPAEPAAQPQPGAGVDMGTGAPGGADSAPAAQPATNEGAPPVQAPPAAPADAPATGASAGMTTPADGAAPDAPADGAAPTGEPSDIPASDTPPTDPAFPTSAGKPTVYLAGDSTVQTYGAAQAPQQGWGQRIQEFFSDDVVFVNRAIGGRSSKSFIDEGRLDAIVADLQRGDYLFAQWGINDRYRSDPARFTDPSTTFKQYLRMYIDGARSKDAIPVLVTPTPRLDFSNGAFQNGFPEYCAAIKELGAETNTPVIDLQTRGLAFYTSIGLDEVEASISLDVLHFKEEGAFQMARLVSEGVEESVLPIGQFVE